MSEPITALEARMLTEQSSEYKIELERALNRINRHIRATAQDGMFSLVLRIGPYADMKDVCSNLKARGFKIKTEGDQTLVTW